MRVYLGLRESERKRAREKSMNEFWKRKENPGKQKKHLRNKMTAGE